MAILNLYHGGKSVPNPNSYAIYPRPNIENDGDDSFDRVSAHKAPSVFGLTREIHFCDCAIADAIQQVKGDVGLEVGDGVVFAVMPPRLIFKGVYFEITKPVEGVSFEVVSFDATGFANVRSAVIDAGAPALGWLPDDTQRPFTEPIGMGIRFTALPADFGCGGELTIHLGLEMLDVASVHMMHDVAVFVDATPA